MILFCSFQDIMPGGIIVKYFFGEDAALPMCGVGGDSSGKGTCVSRLSPAHVFNDKINTQAIDSQGENRRRIRRKWDVKVLCKESYNPRVSLRVILGFHDANVYIDVHCTLSFYYVWFVSRMRSGYQTRGCDATRRGFQPRRKEQAVWFYDGKTGFSGFGR